MASGDRALPAALPGVGIPFDKGLRCVGGNFLRHGVRATDAQGRVGLSNPGWGPPDPPLGGLSAQGAFVAGQSRYFQVFYRDGVQTFCGPGVNASQGVKVTFR